MARILEFDGEKIGFYGEITETSVDSNEVITGHCTEIPPPGLYARIADGFGSKVTKVVPVYDGEFMVGYADLETREPVTLIDGPYKL